MNYKAIFFDRDGTPTYFTSFHLDRIRENHDEWTIHNLKQLIDFINNKR